MTTATDQLTAHDIQIIMAEKMSSTHVCFSEVKDGPSMGVSKSFRLDMVAIKKTWSPVTIKGYEIKTSRSDFVSDTKWPQYMELCNQFYWVCPRGLIKKSEIDERVGLVHVNPKSKAMRTVKRALHRDVEPDPYMLLYLLFWRYDIPQKRQLADDKAERRMGIEREISRNQDVGEMYAYFVAEKLQKSQDAMHKMQIETKDELAKVERVTKWMSEHGYKNGYEITRVLEDMDTLYHWMRTAGIDTNGVKNLLSRAALVECFHGKERAIAQATMVLQSISKALEAKP